MYTLLILGGTSSIALAYARQRLLSIKKEPEEFRIILLGRSSEKLLAEQQDLSARGARVETTSCDLSSISSTDLMEHIKGDVDEVLLAYGTLTENSEAQQEPNHLANSLNTNFVSAAIWLETLASRFDQQGFGRAVVLGSVAGDRGRQSNYIYGSAKSGLDTFVRGLQHRFSRDKRIKFTLIKPGFVDTNMTAHIQSKGKLWSSPEKVARIMEKAMLRDAHTAYAPFYWRWIMFAITVTPTFIFHKTKL